MWYDFSYMKNLYFLIPRTGKFSETVSRSGVTRAWWEGESGTHFLMVIEPFEGDDLKISETVLMIVQPCECNLGHSVVLKIG